MTPDVQVLETFSMVAPLGLRFRDVATGDFIGDGLDVSVYDPLRPATRVQAFPNRMGVYVMHHAPGLREIERGSGDENFWNNLPPQKTFVVTVADLSRRFQSFQFTADLPARGILNWWSPLSSSPLATSASVPLYSSAVRNVPMGMAVLRADLWDLSRNTPASWAVLEAFSNNELVARGIADETGRIALIFPYPAPRPFAVGSPPASPLGSPPIATGPALTEQSWPIVLQARYRPLLPQPALPGESRPHAQLPDLHATLSQPDAALWADAAGTEPLGEVLLQYGRELILKSRSSNSSSLSARRSVLFITSAVSPP